jgi:cation:H+ antiporter
LLALGRGLLQECGVVLELCLLAVGLALIIKGGELFVAAAVRIARLLRLPRVVIGSTLVSLTTTAPELVVSVLAGLKGESGLAIGNAVGSVICNIGLIMGVSASMKQLDVHPRLLSVPLAAMFAAGIAVLVMSLDLSVSRWEGSLLLAGGLAYFACDFIHHWRDRKPADVLEAGVIETEHEARGWAWFQTGRGTTVQFLLGAATVVLGSKLLVDGAVGVAAGLGIPSIIIGLTVVAAGTSLPELTTAVTSSRQAVSDLAVGNVLGANIANLTLIVGTASVIHSVEMSRLTQLFNCPAMLAFMGLLLWVLLTDRRVTRREGAVLLAAYGAYLAVLITLTAFQNLTN